MAIHVNDDGAPNTVTCLFTDLSGNRIDELPLTNVTFGLALNASGPFSGQLNIEDPRVQRLSWLAATAPNLAQVWLDVSGSLVYGGIVTRRRYDRGAGSVQINGTDHWGYLTHRLQAKDYSTTWATVAKQTGAVQIAHQVIADALAVANSIPISLSTPPATPTAYQITLAAPLSQRMSIDSIVNQISSLGWLVGFDYAIDVAYVSGVPTATLSLAYPRRGRTAGTTGLVLDASVSTAFVYDESGESQATKVAEVASGSGGVASDGSWPAANTVDGYPLLERVGSHASFSSAATSASVLRAFVQNDLALSAYPVVSPQITMPMFAEPAIGEWIVGDDVRVVVPSNSTGALSSGAGGVLYPGSGTYPGPSTFPGGSAPSAGGVPLDPRFPKGMDFYWRIAKADASIPAEGVPTVTYTFNMPPTSTPQRPPQ